IPRLPPALLAALLAAAGLRGGEEPLRLEAVPFRLPGPVEKVFPVDLDGDGLADLACLVEDRLEVFFQEKGGRFSEAPQETLRIGFLGPAGGARAVGLALAPLERGGPAVAAALLEGRTVKVWRMD